MSKDIETELAPGVTLGSTLARLSTRGSGQDGKGTVDLIIGVGMKDNALKPDTIYEIRECMGELTVVEIGPSAARTEECPKNLWNCEVSQIISCYRPRWFLTLAEFLKLRAQPVAD